MDKGRVPLILAIVMTLLGGASCAAEPEPTQKPTPLPESTDTPVPRDATVSGPSCPEAFREAQQVSRTAEVDAGAAVTLTLSSTPSMPCGWQAPTVADDALLRQVDHTTKWPAEGVTPMPGAPGVEIWGLEALGPGQTTVMLECACLDETGAEQISEGTFILEAMVR